MDFSPTGRDLTRELEDIRLPQDNGADLCFSGRLFAESSWYDEDAGTLTRQKLYATDTNEQIYYIVRGSGKSRMRSAYRVTVDNGICHIRNGTHEMSLQCDSLLLVVRMLCGLKDNESLPSFDSVVEMLHAANS